MRHHILLSVLLSAASLCTAQTANVQDVVRQVRQSSYTHDLANLLFTHAGDNRGAQAPQHDAARQNIVDTFTRFGLAVTLEPFTYQDATYYNISATLPGKLRPGEYYIVGAHYDSVNNPGADDDASGVAGLLEAARVASLHDFEASIRFIAFDREEAGLIGSKAWASAHTGDRILGMVQLDMISFNPPGYNHNIVAVCPPNGQPNATLNLMESTITRYSGGLTGVYGGIATGSDHTSFAPLTQSAEVIEAGFYSNTSYHKAADSVDTPNYVDYTFATGVTRSVVGYLAEQARLMPENADALRLGTAGIANAASYVAGTASPSALVTVTGTGFGGEGPAVAVSDSAGSEQPAALVYVSPTQINLVMPAAIAPGPATLTVSLPDGRSASASLTVEAVSPGIFTAGATGSGAAAAQAVRVAPSGAQTIENLFDAAGAVPVDFGADGDRVVLVLYGTGIRGRSALAAVTVKIGDTDLPAQYAGPQPDFAGLDQVNVELPRSLAGRGVTAITLGVDGKAATPVMVDLGIGTWIAPPVSKVR